MPTALDERLSRLFCLEHKPSERPYPCKLQDSENGRVTYRIAAA